MEEFLKNHMLWVIVAAVVIAILQVCNSIKQKLLLNSRVYQLILFSFVTMVMCCCSSCFWTLQTFSFWKVANKNDDRFLSSFQLLGIVFACCLMKGIRSGYEVMWSTPEEELTVRATHKVLHSDILKCSSYFPRYTQNIIFFIQIIFS